MSVYIINCLFTASNEAVDVFFTKVEVMYQGKKKALHLCKAFAPPLGLEPDRGITKCPVDILPEGPACRAGCGLGRVQVMPKEKAIISDGFSNIAPPIEKAAARLIKTIKLLYSF